MALLTSKKFSFVSTVLPEDTFSVIRFTGFEGISRLYEFEISLASDNPDIDPDLLLAHPVCLTIHRGESEDVSYHGILRRFEQQREYQGFVFYRAVLVPRLWWLTLARHNRVFLDESVPAVTARTLLEGGLFAHDYEFRLAWAYPDIPYVCQYGESNLNFISRRLEREGMYFYFGQEDAGEKLIITDALSFHELLPRKHDLSYSPPSGLDSTRSSEIIQSFSCCRQPLPYKVVLRDYNYEHPSLEVLGEAVVDPAGRGEVCLYGEHFSTPEEGNRLAAIRAEELFCRKQDFFGESAAPFLMPGFLFTLNSHYRESFNRDYLITEVTHEGNQTGYLVSGLGEAPPERERSVFYRNSFKAIPSDIQYRPERKAEKPRMAGSLHARVDAEGAGNYAELDTQGRYKVRLPFDTDTAHGAGKASHFVRMAQPYSGPDYGVHFPLHKGAEVLLTFVDGDPDRPVISGAVPNPETASPVTAANQTKSIFRDNYGNELVFDSTPGDEHIRLFSPHHTSRLELGRSFTEVTESDRWSCKGGNSTDIGLGNKLAIHAGNILDAKAGMTAGIFLGLTNAFQLGGKHDWLIGHNLGVHWGPEFKWHRGATVEKSAADRTSFAQEDNIVSAKGTCSLVGGASSDAQNSVFTSILNLDNHKITLSVGNNKNPDSTEKETEKLTSKIKCAIGFSTLAAAVAAALTTVGLAVSDKDAKMGVSISFSTVETIAMMVCLGFMKHYNSQLTSSIKAVSHFDHDEDEISSLIKTDDEGILLAAKLDQGAGRIPDPKHPPADWTTQLTSHSKSFIHIEKAGPITINSKPVDIQKSKITIGIGDIAAADDAQDARIILQKTGANINIQSGKAKIWMEKNGIISLDNRGATAARKGIQVVAEKDALIRSETGNIVLSASAGQLWVKTRIKHKNLEVLA